MKHGSDVWSKEQSLEESQKKKNKTKGIYRGNSYSKERRLIRGGRGQEFMENVQLFLKKKSE